METKGGRVRPIPLARRVLRERSNMPPSESEREREDALTRRAEDLQALREAEHDTALSGDQREVSGEISLVGQHPADVADFTYQREMQQTTQQLIERETARAPASAA
jgi:hypothetical protein